MFNWISKNTWFRVVFSLTLILSIIFVLPQSRIHVCAEEYYFTYSSKNFSVEPGRMWDLTDSDYAATFLQDESTYEAGDKAVFGIKVKWRAFNGFVVFKKYINGEDVTYMYMEDTSNIDPRKYHNMYLPAVTFTGVSVPITDPSKPVDVVIEAYEFTYSGDIGDDVIDEFRTNIAIATDFSQDLVTDNYTFTAGPAVSLCSFTANSNAPQITDSDEDDINKDDVNEEDVDKTDEIKTDAKEPSDTLTEDDEAEVIGDKKTIDDAKAPEENSGNTTDNNNDNDSEPDDEKDEDSEKDNEPLPIVNDGSDNSPYNTPANDNNETSINDSENENVINPNDNPESKNDFVQEETPVIEIDEVKVESPIIENNETQKDDPVVEYNDVKEIASEVEYNDVQETAPVVEYNDVQEIAPVVEYNDVQETAPEVENNDMSNENSENETSATELEAEENSTQTDSFVPENSNEHKESLDEETDNSPFNTPANDNNETSSDDSENENVINPNENPESKNDFVQEETPVIEIDEVPVNSPITESDEIQVESLAIENNDVQEQPPVDYDTAIPEIVYTAVELTSSTSSYITAHEDIIFTIADDKPATGFIDLEMISNNKVVAASKKSKPSKIAKTSQPQLITISKHHTKPNFNLLILLLAIICILMVSRKHIQKEYDCD